ncbi:MAG: molybdate ABC transporter substrate-binding protein, partial [Proteobacteria bacterium]|nr:molybdate ABC transporter substrate-binding protein [Pseudomonadota bacterium]
MAAGATNRTGDRSSREEAPRKPRSLGLRKAVLALLVATVSGVAFGAQSELLVSAAASLTNAFGAMAPAFEAAHPGAAVTLNFAASGALLRQVDQGAPVDVFASADQETMDRAAGKGLLAPDSRKDFARNRPVLV